VALVVAVVVVVIGVLTPGTVQGQQLHDDTPKRPGSTWYKNSINIHQRYSFSSGFPKQIATLTKEGPIMTRSTLFHDVNLPERSLESDVIQASDNSDEREEYCLPILSSSQSSSSEQASATTTPAHKRVKLSRDMNTSSATATIITPHQSQSECTCCGTRCSTTTRRTGSRSCTGNDSDPEEEVAFLPSPTLVTPTTNGTPFAQPSPPSSKNESHDSTFSSPEVEKDVIVITPKRQGYLSWDDYFMAVALLSSKRSKDPMSPTGACIVDPHHVIVGIGYNGFPRGCSDDVLPWATPTTASEGSGGEEHDDDQAGIPSAALSWLHTQEPYMVHAITNAILNKCSHDVAGCRLYVTEFPSSDCAKEILQSRIAEVVVLQRETDRGCVPSSSSPDTQASQVLLHRAEVKVRFYRPTISSILLNFVTALSPSTTTPNESDKTVKPPVVPANEEQEAMRRLLWDEAKYDITATHNNNKTRKRLDYISWKDYFMAMAFLTAQRSKDPNTQVGACIVDDDFRIVGLGYNGFPRGCNDDEMPWARSNRNPLHNKYLYVCHAEVNAILNKGSANVKGSTLYVALFPCNNCAKMIIQAGIRRVVYMSDSYHDTDGCRASRILLRLAKVELEQYTPTVQQMELQLGKETKNETKQT
jgi:dCMP deaminase